MDKRGSDDLIRQYLETIRYLRARQIIARVRLRLAARARALFPTVTKGLYHRRLARSGLTWREGLFGLTARADEVRRGRTSGVPDRLTRLLRGRWNFLSDEAELGWPPDWSAPGRTRLWLFHLHYFDDLLDLGVGVTPGLAPVLQLIEDWSQTNVVDDAAAARAAWHPYTVSLRMVNWMLALSAVAEARDVPPAIRRALELHAIFLERNLEVDNGGNHLLKNLKAMVFAGCFWTGPRAEAWRVQYSEWFARELENQTLADGGHYERSPMYHCQVLADAIEVAAILRGTGHDNTRVRDLVDRLESFLPLITHPDGDIALLNDSAFGMTSAPADLHHAVNRLHRRQSMRSLPVRLELLLPDSEEWVADPQDARIPISPALAASASGYVSLPAGVSGRFLVADVGRVCPDDLPAHAHADLLSFELSLNGCRMIVDSGVGEYESGPWRQYYRSTRAHNVISVNGSEQSDCWASFRVGRRAEPSGITVSRQGEWSLLAAEHNGFAHLKGRVRHRRCFAWSDADLWVIADSLLGHGQHQWQSFCHFHPDVVVVAHDQRSIRVALRDAILDVAWFGFDRASVVRGDMRDLQGWYADRFGPPRPSTVLVLDRHGRVPAKCGYALVPRETADAQRATVDDLGTSSIEISVGASRHRFSLN